MDREGERIKRRYGDNIVPLIVDLARRFIVLSPIATGQKRTSGWKGVVGAALTVVVLSAVAVVALTLPGVEVFASWTTPENAEKVMASRSVSRGPLTLEAPASTLMRFRAETTDAQKSKDLAGNIPLLVKDWKYTNSKNQPSAPQQPPAENSLVNLIQQSWTLYAQTTAFRAAEEVFDAYIALLTQNAMKVLPPQLAAFVTSRLEAINTLVDQLGTTYVQTAAAWQSFINQFIPPPLRPPAIPPASPSI